jgi:ABC-2 type transport system ATP-binding protein
MLIIDRITKSYGKLRAVDDISMEIHRGECLGLLGPNGAGKSTTISLIVGLLKPDSGSVLLEGQAPDLADTRRKIGLAPQSISLYEELTARENLTFFGRLYGLTSRRLRERVEWALDLAGLKDRAEQRVQYFSGGMKRRLNIAVAMVHQPQLLLLDEPTVGVDPQSRNHIFQWIEQLKSAGMTLIYTTHYIEEAQRLCDRVAIMDNGRLLALDSVDQLLADYGNKSVVSGQIEYAPEGVEVPGSCVESGWRLESDHPFDIITSLAQSGVRFRSVQIAGPDLESVFLSLTGRGLRD